MYIIRWSMREQCLCMLKPPHDSRDCVKVVSVSYCASDQWNRAEKIRNAWQSSWGDGFDWTKKDPPLAG